MALSRLSIISIFFLTPAASGVLGGSGGAGLVEEVVLLRGAELGESMAGTRRRSYAWKVATDLATAIRARDFCHARYSTSLLARTRGLWGVHALFDGCQLADGSLLLLEMFLMMIIFFNNNNNLLIIYIILSPPLFFPEFFLLDYLINY